MKIVSSKTIYQDDYIEVLQDSRLIGKHKGTFTYLKARNKSALDTAVVVMPLTESGLYMLKQYRVANHAYFWQFPGGGVEEADTIEASAMRELEEEAGLQTKEITHLGTAVLEPGAVAQSTHFTCAQKLTQTETHHEDHEEIIEVRHFTFKQIDQMIENSEIQCGFALVGILLLKQKGYWKA